MKSIFRFLLVVSLCWACSDNGKGTKNPDAEAKDVQALDAGDSKDSTDASNAAKDGADDAADEVGVAPTSVSVAVEVLLDGAPSPDTLVVQGGNTVRWTTDDQGRVTVDVDLTVPGDHFLMATHPDARTRGNNVYGDTTSMVIELTSFDTSDNEDYVFKDPGEPGMSHVIEKCGHCHLSVIDTWFESAHRTSGTNPFLHDVYSGTADTWNSETDCTLRGGQWVDGKEPGTGNTIKRCQVATSVADFESNNNGACADCHAPGIDGKIGGRDLLEASGHSYDYGVHCEVCHHVESVDLSGGPGVSGSLKILRPSEDPPIPGVGEFNPLLFCPDPDVANRYMGCVQRDHFRESNFCAGCHEYNQASMDVAKPVDTARWPDGRIPVHSTYTEWGGSPYAASMSCQACHMPFAEAEVTNSADLQFFGEAVTGVTGGWPRPPGHLRLHTWSGPRSPESYRLAPPLSTAVEKTVADGKLTASVTITNAAAGHSIPTGEPLRVLLLLVSASCDGASLKAVGGDAVPSFGGAVAIKEKGEDWTKWDKAQKGYAVRVIQRPGGYYDYEGFGPFGDGTFSAEKKGMPMEKVVGESTITLVEDGVASFDKALPEGDAAYLVEPPPEDSAIQPRTVAGQSGFAFARVLVGADGTVMVPHFLANDIQSDNRILSGKDWTSEHIFQATCDDPTVTTTLIQRAVPYALATQRGWSMRDSVMATTTK